MSAPAAKVPVLRLVRHAYLELIGRRRGLVEAGGLWLVLPWVLHTLGGVLGSLLGDLALTAGFAALAVAWHRAILLNEPLPRPFAPLTANVARYLGLSVIVVVLAVAPIMMVGLLLAGFVGGETPQEPGLLPALLLAAGAVLSLIVAMRMQIVFPAAAVGERQIGLAAAWAATRGNAWRLLAGLLLVCVPAVLLGAGLAIALSSLAESTGSLVLGWLARLAPIAGAWIQAPLLASFLSYAYLFLNPTPRFPATS
jgi:hypothetical protein